MRRDTLAHYYELITLLRDGSLGRRTLVTRSSMTESTVRTHLRKLEKLGYIRSDQHGTELTSEARRDFRDLLSRITLVDPPTLSELRIDAECTGAFVTGVGEDLRRSVRYRDDAVRGGATGAILLTYEEGFWSFSDIPSRIEIDYPNDGREILSTLSSIHPESGDGLVFSFGPDSASARAGLWYMLASLVPTDAQIETQSSR